MTVHAMAGFLFAASGIVILAWTVVSFVSALLSGRWPMTTGTVVASQLERSHGVDGYGYRPGVFYSYAVEDEKFVASRTKFGDVLDLSWAGSARRIIQRYPVGKVVAVHYNPDDPADAVLEPGVSLFLFAWAAFGGVFTLMGVLVMR